MQNETIDKLKNAGYITVTDDSQGIADKVGIGGGGGGSLNTLDVPYVFPTLSGQVSHTYGFQPQSETVEGLIEEYNAFLEETTTELGITISQLNDIINGKVDRLINHCDQEIEGDVYNSTMMSKLEDSQCTTCVYAEPYSPMPGVTITGEYTSRTVYTGIFQGMTGGEISEPVFSSAVSVYTRANFVEGYEDPVTVGCSITFTMHPFGG